MKITVLAVTAASALLLFQPTAMAQTNSPNKAPAANAKGATASNVHNKQGLRAQVRDMLQKEGFTNVRVMPSSFMVCAKGKDGNPVVMSISPNCSLKFRRLARLPLIIPSRARWI